jgi:enoyl-CoA hydratase/carnithine racemase
MHGHIRVVRLVSNNETNRLTQACILSLYEAFHELARDKHPIILTGNKNFFSVGADLTEIAKLTAPAAYEFSKIGQVLMNFVSQFPAPVYAAIAGFCMGGGLDLALACHQRIAAPNAVFGHRGVALGLMTGWGGTQRLPRLVGKGRALQIFAAAETIPSLEALRIGLVDYISDDPVADAIRRSQELCLHASPHLFPRSWNHGLTQPRRASKPTCDF